MSPVHVAAAFLTILVTVIVIGSVCATEGALKHSLPIGWGLGGAGCVLIGAFLGGWPQIILTVAPIVAVLTLKKQPTTYEEQIHEMHVVGPRHSNLMIAKLGIVLAAVLLPYVAFAGLLASAQRTGAAQATIVSKEQVTAARTVGARRTYNYLTMSITYTFTADGKVRKSTTQRNWTPEQISSAKVCYDPYDIDGSHSLELSGYTCGTFDLHPNG
jgi:hypothetical protein